MSYVPHICTVANATQGMLNLKLRDAPGNFWANWKYDQSWLPEDFHRHSNRLTRSSSFGKRRLSTTGAAQRPSMWMKSFKRHWCSVSYYGTCTAHNSRSVIPKMQLPHPSRHTSPPRRIHSSRLPKSQLFAVILSGFMWNVKTLMRHRSCSQSQPGMNHYRFQLHPSNPHQKIN
ncbi:hypothetical protein A0H81_10350 [Grifola frondosa]|uniref:Uncharacterized protein n=1 Tax=Grifola frondosa TaxID=5627 RepID=A0A1C7LZV9_GRIFR|nr:hypothetical protein A0H81_10350 [Grifola frondosa]